MKEYIKIAWRNLWRNKRRTAITSASILFAVFFALLMRSFQLGTYDHMIKNAIESFSGFIKVQHKDFQDDPILENTFQYDNALISRLESTDGIKAMVPRVETFALASSGPFTKGALILGINPEVEKGLSDPEKRLVRHQFSIEVINSLKANSDIPEEVKSKLDDIKTKSYANKDALLLDLGYKEKDAKQFLPILLESSAFKGESLRNDDDGVLLSDRLAKYLKLNVGDTLILLGQGFQGATAAGLYPVRGLVKFPNPELDNKLIYMTLPKAQDFANLDNRVTSIAINLHDNSERNMFAKEAELNAALTGASVEAINWQKFNKVLWQQIEGDNMGGVFMLALLYFIVFFGIIGTVLMMIHERIREFGVLVAVGMRKTKLAAVILVEMMFMGLIGVFLGTLFSTPLIYILHKNPIRLTGEMEQMMESYGIEPLLPLAWLDNYTLWQCLIVILMVIVSCTIPLRKVLKLKPVQALKA